VSCTTDVAGVPEIVGAELVDRLGRLPLLEPLESTVRSPLPSGAAPVLAAVSVSAAAALAVSSSDRQPCRASTVQSIRATLPEFRIRCLRLLRFDLGRPNRTRPLLGIAEARVTVPLESRLNRKNPTVVPVRLATPLSLFQRPVALRPDLTIGLPLAIVLTS
jgi:hypothetical protein